MASDQDTPNLPPVSAYLVTSDPVHYLKTGSAMRYAGDKGDKTYLNSNAQKAFNDNPKSGSDLLLDISKWPSPQISVSNWMTMMWEADGRHIGLRGKWLSTIALPETHDSMALELSGSDGGGAAQNKRFREQLYGGVRSFDMRYVNAGNDSTPNYVGYHFYQFPYATMYDCILALREFLEDPTHRHEFIVLKLRYRDGDNDATAMRMFAHFVDRLKEARITGGNVLDRVLPEMRDASGNEISYEQFPISTLEKLNVSLKGGFKNLLLTMQPNDLKTKMSASYPEQSAYYWAHKKLWVDHDEDNPVPYTPYSAKPPYFGMSTVGVDKSGVFSPDRPKSMKLAALSLDCMLFNPCNEWLRSNNRLPRNAYGSENNYNCIAANWFEDSTFIPYILEINKFDDYADIYPLQTPLKLIIKTDGREHVATIGEERDSSNKNYLYGSLGLARSVQAALYEFDKGFVVTYMRSFTIKNERVAFSIEKSPLATVMGLPYGQAPAKVIQGSIMPPRRNYNLSSTPWLGTEYRNNIGKLTWKQDNQIVVPNGPAVLGRADFLWQGGYGLINLRLADTTNTIIQPAQYQFKNNKYGENWVTSDFTADKLIVEKGPIIGFQFGYKPGHGLINVKILRTDKTWTGWLTTDLDYEFVTDPVDFLGGLTMLKTRWMNGFGLVDARIDGALYEWPSTN